MTSGQLCTFQCPFLNFVIVNLFGAGKNDDLVMMNYTTVGIVKYADFYVFGFNLFSTFEQSIHFHQTLLKCEDGKANPGV